MAAPPHDVLFTPDYAWARVKNSFERGGYVSQRDASSANVCEKHLPIILRFFERLYVFASRNEILSDFVNRGVTGIFKLSHQS